MTPPGTLIAILAYLTSTTHPPSSATAYVTVPSRVWRSPVYLCGRYIVPAAAGVTVRWPVFVGQGWLVCEGVELRDGRVLSHGAVVEVER